MAVQRGILCTDSDRQSSIALLKGRSTHSMSFRLVFIVLLATNQQVGQAHPLAKLMDADIVPENHVTQVNYETFAFASVFVLVSWISLIIPPFCIEGRLAVLMASLLAEANISNNAHSQEVRDSQCKTHSGTISIYLC